MRAFPKHASIVAGILFAGVLQTTNVFAQAYPSKPIHFIVPYGAGGAADTQARAIAASLSRILNQVVLVENRPGAGGTLGAAIAAKAAPDGYTLLMNGVGIQAISPHLYSNLTYDSNHAFMPITMTSKASLTLTVSPGLQATNVREFIALAKAHPGTLNFSSPGIGSIVHLAGELFKAKSQTDMVHVPFNSGLESLTAVIAGQVQLSFAQIGTAIVQAKDNKVRVLAVTQETRSARAPELPTVAEAGLPGYAVTDWSDVVVPTGTPPAIVATLSKALIEALKDPATNTVMTTQGFDVVTTTPEETTAFVNAEYEKWGTVIKSAQIKIQ